MLSSLRSNTLEVPGARLHYEVVGSGPALALIGLPMTGKWFARLGSCLADEYTVVTYDPRGFGASTIDDPGQDSTPELVADDVHHVLAEVTDRPAVVFGSSGGGVTGLELVTRHPEQVRTLVAHEPPVIEMLPDAERVQAGMREVYDTYRAEGADVAFGKFMALAGFQVPEPDPAAPAPTPPSDQDRADGERMLAHSLLPTATYRPDIAALKAASSRVVIAGGVASVGQLARRTADALAEALGSPLAEFPGDHGGFLDPGAATSPNCDPEAFARVLRRILAED